MDISANLYASLIKKLCKIHHVYLISKVLHSMGNYLYPFHKLVIPGTLKYVTVNSTHDV